MTESKADLDTLIESVLRRVAGAASASYGELQDAAVAAKAFRDFAEGYAILLGTTAGDTAPEAPNAGG